MNNRLEFFIVYTLLASFMFIFTSTLMGTVMLAFYGITVLIERFVHENPAAVESLRHKMLK